MPGLSHLPATSALLRHACCPAALAPGRLGSSVHARAFGIKTTLKVQERLSKMIKRDQAGKSSDEMQITGPEPYRDTILESMPSELRVPRNPAPMREDTMAHTWTTSDLESIDIGATKHRVPDLISDKLALWAVKSARKPTDVFFRNKYLHRSVMLEVVAAVPGMVGGLIRHIKSLQGMRHDGGWIGHLLHEAENERMHLMTWMEVGKPVLWERALIATVQTGFFAVFSLLYMVSPRTAHRVVGYLEEEAVTSYTHFI
ncbi:inducible alternative oxidase 2, partial [Coemansia sp. RSA 2611]